MFQLAIQSEKTKPTAPKRAILKETEENEERRAWWRHQNIQLWLERQTPRDKQATRLFATIGRKQWVKTAAPSLCVFLPSFQRGTAFGRRPHAIIFFPPWVFLGIPVLHDRIYAFSCSVHSFIHVLSLLKMSFFMPSEMCTLLKSLSLLQVVWNDTQIVYDGS